MLILLRLFSLLSVSCSNILLTVCQHFLDRNFLLWFSVSDTLTKTSLSHHYTRRRKLFERWLMRSAQSRKPILPSHRLEVVSLTSEILLEESPKASYHHSWARLWWCQQIKVSLTSVRHADAALLSRRSRGYRRIYEKGITSDNRC